MGSSSEASIERVFREEHGRIIASLIRGLGDFELAEDALQDAFTEAVSRWPRDGVPANPAAWLTTTARRKALDRLRRDANFARRKEALAHLAAQEADVMRPPQPESSVSDDRLRLIFTCCHPALPMEARVALTLRTLGGLTTPEIARAFLVSETTMAQRLVRAKRRIREQRIPYAVPEDHLLVERLGGVLAVVYLVFTEGYAASAGDSLIRGELCAEAIRLARLLSGLMPDEPEVLGLLALVLLHDARSAARVDHDGELLTLEEQDRTRWDGARIAEGAALVERALRMRRPGPYQVQAAIAAVHGQAATAAETDWHEIAALYGRLAAMTPGPVVELNRAAAIAMAEGPRAGLALLHEPALAAELDTFHLYHAAMADLHRRLGEDTAAAERYERALVLVTNPAQRRYLERRLREVSGATPPASSPPAIPECE